MIRVMNVDEARYVMIALSRYGALLSWPTLQEIRDVCLSFRLTWQSHAVPVPQSGVIQQEVLHAEIHSHRDTFVEHLEANKSTGISNDYYVTNICILYCVLYAPWKRHIFFHILYAYKLIS